MAARTNPSLIAQAVRLAGEGYSIRAIEHKVGVDAATLHPYLVQRGVRPGKAAYTLPRVAELFRVSETTVLAWERAGLIHSLRGSDRPRARRAYPMAQLLAFVQRRGAWPAYEPRLIAHDAVRSTALEARAAAGGTWVPRHELPDAVGAGERAVQAALAAGWLADWEWTTDAGRRFVWRPNGAHWPPMPRGIYRAEREAARTRAASKQQRRGQHHAHVRDQVPVLGPAQAGAPRG